MPSLALGRGRTSTGMGRAGMRSACYRAAGGAPEPVHGAWARVASFGAFPVGAHVTRLAQLHAACLGPTLGQLW